MAFKHPPLPSDDAPFDDLDNPEWTAETFARAIPADQLPAEVLAGFPRTKKPGRPVAQTPKVPTSIRLDQDVLAHFKAMGKGWQTRVNETLRKAMG